MDVTEDFLTQHNLYGTLDPVSMTERLTLNI